MAVVNQPGRNKEGLKNIVASADLSSYQHYFVTLSDDLTASLCGANGISVGILMNKPDAAGVACEIAGPGEVAILKVNEACNDLAKLTSTSGGLGEVVDAAGEWCGAIALETAAAQNDKIMVLVTAFTAHAA